MRPTEGPTSNVFEVEISPCEFFKDLAVMVVEGRVPELSQNGRRAGFHSWPLSRNSMKKCCFGNTDKEICELVSATRAKMSSHLPVQSLIIDVFANPEAFENSSKQKKQNRIYITKSNKLNAVLIEKWKIELTDKSEIGEKVNVSMVLQAVRSFLHFSQLSAWWNKSQGTFPANVNYQFSPRISLDKDEDFITATVIHKFPMTEISKTEAIQITVLSLPRMTKTELTFMLTQQKNLFTFDGGGKGGGVTNSKIENSAPKILNSQSIETSKLPCTKCIGETNCSKFNSLIPNNSHDSSFGKRKDTDLDSYFSNHHRSSNCQTTNYVGEKHLKLDGNWRESHDSESHVYNCSKLVDNDSNSTHDKEVRSCNSLSALLEQDLTSLPSSSSGSGATNIIYNKAHKGIEDLLQDFVIDTSSKVIYSSDDDDDEEDDDDDDDDDNEDEDDIDKRTVNSSDSKDDNVFESNKTSPPTCNVTSCYNNPMSFRMRSKSVSPHFSKYKDQNHNLTMKTKPIAARRLAMVAGTVPIFNVKTGLPLSSSPAPIKKSRKVSDCSGNSLSRSSSYDDLKPTAYGLSKSAPPTTGLLGNFEESVLKGRIPVNGTLKGFRAELSASGGTFCSKHVSLPVRVQYFNLSDDNAPSPYLGHINLYNKKLKMKRFRVPRKGTVQLTIFNPNNTVVKVFVVLYNLEDMPASTQTFLRQRMVSTRKDPKSLADVQLVHYLVHLSFVSSQNSHIYLHSDIRIIFPQQDPDRHLLTITDSPTDPKYTPITYLKRRVDVGIEI